MIDRGMIAALGLSVLAHAALIGSAGWTLPGLPADVPAVPAPLIATMHVLPVPVELKPVALKQVDMPAAAKPASKPVAKPAQLAALAPPAEILREALPEPVPEPLPEAMPELAEAAAMLAEAEAPAVVTAPDATTDAVQEEVFDLDGWPAQGAIVYRVFYGSSGLQVGEARHQWSHDDTQYSMQVTLETTGLAALLHGFHYVQKSEGSLGPEGLRPHTFTVAQKGKSLESARFDWDNAQVSIRRGERERRKAALQTGDQDVLSLWHQIGIVGTSGLPRTITVVSNKEATPALLEQVGEEGLRLPIGNLKTLRVRAQAENGKLTIDIWLARNYGMLPVRIRMVDDKGEVLDQQAIQLRLAPSGETPNGTADAADTIELKEEVPVSPLADLHTN